MTLTLSDIEQRFATQGSALYGGEAISQLEHGLQAAYLAEQAGEDDALVIACLLHDLGHLLFEQGDDDVANGIDDLHQFKILPFLRPVFPNAVVDAIGLHVDAKRYLCRSEVGYLATLSDASRRSLDLQGGVMSEAEAAHFATLPHASRAIALRRYDDAAKVVGFVTPGFEHFTSRLAALSQA